MRWSIMFLCPFVALAAIPIEKRQSELLGNGKFEAAKLFKQEVTASTYQKGSQTRDDLVRPIQASGGELKTESGTSMDPAGTAWTQLATDFPTDITILRAGTIIVFPDGVRARAQTGVYNHHVALIDVMKHPPEITRCKNRANEFPGRFSIVLGNPEDAVQARYTMTEEAEKKVDFKTGYHIKKGNPLVMMVDLVNYEDTTREVYLKADFDYLEGKQEKQYETSMQTWRLEECNGKEDYLAINIPKGQNIFSLKSQEMTVMKDGWFYFGRGHTHDGGVSMIINLNGKDVCKSDAIYGVDEAIKGEDGKDWVTIKDMTVCDTPVKLTKGDTLIVESTYDFDKHPRRKQHNGGMGELMATFSYVFASE